MKRIPLFFALSLLLSAACRRKPDLKAFKDRLEITMSKHLADRQGGQDAKPRFDVLDVNYFKDSTFYLCEFKIKMTLPNGQDTIGTMKEKLSLDGRSVLPPGIR